MLPHGPRREPVEQVRDIVWATALIDCMSNAGMDQMHQLRRQHRARIAEVPESPRDEDMPSAQVSRHLRYIMYAVRHLLELALSRRSVDVIGSRGRIGTAIPKAVVLPILRKC